MDTQKEAKTPVALIVDDDLSFLDKIQRSLRESFTVQTATSGVEAIQKIRSLSVVDALVVSEELPRMKGTELLRIIHEMIPRSDSLIKILITEKASNGTVIDLARHGRIDCCLSKPVDPAAILRKLNYLIAKKSREKRTAMRVTLNRPSDIRIETGDAEEVKVVNLSENGMFLKTLNFYPEGSSVPLKITLPDGRQYAASGRIVRQDINQGGVGLEFETIDEESRLSILQFLSDYVTLRDLPSLKLRYPFLRTEEMILFSDSLKIESLLREAMEMGVEVIAIHAQTSVSENLEFRDLRPPTACVLGGKDLNVTFKTSDLLFVSFQIGYATYNFETMISRISPDGESFICLYPSVMFYSEKRTEKRISPQGSLRIEIPLPPPFDGRISGRVTDISPGGVSFVTEGDTPILLKGTPLDRLRILDGTELLWEENGEVRYVAGAADGPVERRKIGVQFGISRMSIQTVTIPPATAVPVSEPAPPAPAALAGKMLADRRDESADHSPEVVRIENDRGEEIVGLLNASLPLTDDPVPVVLVPPAFGKTKETLFGLALTITKNFRRLGKPIAVIRYDGIQRKGESTTIDPPYEMLKTTFTQSAEDIITLLDWIDLNPKIKAGPVILLTFSFSALEARVVLRDEVQRRRIQYWIACMGTPEFRDLMVKVNCGLDFLEHYQLGIKLGVMPVLGNQVNVDAYVGDGAANAVATLEQAREDMRHLDIPITWIHGQHDKWVKSEFIRDIMSVRAEAPREVLSVPIGHNARTSREALHLFGSITSLLHRFLHDSVIQPVLPEKSEMEIMRRAEKDRLPPRKLKNRISYWHHYLVGDDKLLGFDIMAMSDDYQQLMADQLQALNLQPSDRLLDLGGGTGNFIEHMLEKGKALPAQITIADLIPEAMEQAFRKLTTRYEILRDPARFNLIGLDLEMSRFLAVRRFLRGEIGTFEQMADKIENLTLESALKIQKAYSPRLHRILRGEEITPAHEEWLKSSFDLYEYQIITDFNRAARYVRRLLPEKPEFRRLALPGYLEGNLHLPIKARWYNKILMSLVLSYIFDPVESLEEVRRIIAPGGRLVLSSMRPDTDASGPFTRLLEKIEAMPAEALPPKWEKASLLESLRSFLNDAQELVDLEEAGTFDFFDPEKLVGLMEESGWEISRIIPTYGDPPQGYVVVAKARDNHGQA